MTRRAEDSRVIGFPVICGHYSIDNNRRESTCCTFRSVAWCRLTRAAAIGTNRWTICLMNTMGSGSVL
jgi:hypothetical protein